MSREIELSEAATAGDIELVKAILAEKCIDMDSLDMIALGNAAAAGHLAIAELLLDNNVDIENDYDPREALDSGYESTPLLRACLNNQINMVRFLIERGAKINQRYHHIENYFLHIACKKGFNDILDLLLNQEGIRFDTAQLFISAAIDSQIDTLAFLISRGLDVNSTVNQPRFLLGGIEYGIHNYDSVLGMASRLGRIDVLDFLLKQDSLDVNKMFANGAWTPLIAACHFRQIDVIDRLLLHKDIQINLSTGHDTPLFRTCVTEGNIIGSIDILDRLLMHGVDVNFDFGSGSNVLMMMINDPVREIRNQMMIRLINNSSINLRQINSQGKDLMQLAIDNNNEDIIASLVARNINDPRSLNISSSSSGYDPRFHSSVTPDMTEKHDNNNDSIPSKKM